MAKMIRRSVSVFLLLLVLAQLLPYSPASATEDVYYGEAYLDLQTEAQRTAYRLVEEGIAGLSPEIVFQGVVEIRSADLLDVLRAVCVDHPQYFWFLEEGAYYYDPVSTKKTISTFVPRYILNGEGVTASSQELADAMHAFHDKVRQIIDSIPINYTTEYEIALYLHDYLAEHVTYTLEGEHPSAYAALVLGEAACYGYSKAYQCLLNAAGIRARTITGDTPDEAGNLAGHAWNQVWLDGKCYYTDVTWDDYEDVTLHACFAMSLEEVSKDHFAEEEFVLPECDHEPMNYYIIGQGNGIAQWNASTTAAEAAACFRPKGAEKDEAVFECEILFEGNGFFVWLEKNYEEICRQMGLSDKTEVYYYSLYNVYYLILVDGQIAVPVISAITLNEENIGLPGAGTQFQLLPQVSSDKVWTPDLVYTSSDESVARVDAQGLVTAVSDGTAVITASSPDGSASASCAVTVSPAPDHVHSMRMFTGKNPTCTNDGYETYYLCTGCGRHFGDETGTVEYSKTSEFMLPAAHTRLLYFSEYGCHVQRCKCGEEIPESKGKHVDEDEDGICEICNLSTASMGLSNQNAGSQKAKLPIPGWVLAVVIVVLVGVVVLVVILVRRRRY